MIDQQSGNDGYDGNANPHTGAPALIVIPAALVGCILLAKGDKKRKRNSRR